ncbi:MULTISPECIES: FUSC family protein [unclassified Undibacterium]|uniref:FUSC family protein n=1 Tax=unclassified Undibacterium TaxID=2630295 RepID=UPI002AC97A52|nr:MULTISPECIES: FUSC family protein [unclassified Undibacterium]MEB0137730.1 FUSC family protein [Undibacterium sp. CCC2.1]MEB0172828.1 FUSC family protein [Undibacterium sp. CCC1.1]MEB0176698.1 FUSC family protein [Undibacterium sp. CCC3.4]MEB0215976.1 FUSC family protein [Undibacterium sp. 5I2]WPX42305.1 FUSC family protein [Undibacterium sp. CCC3.4]
MDIYRFCVQEFAPFPGRGRALLRYLLSCTIVILCSMTLQLPFLAVSLILVFFTIQENTVLTRVSALVLISGSTLAVLALLLLLKWTIELPLLRLLGTALIALSGLVFMRTSKFGGAGFLLALFTTNLQGMADVTSDPELLTRTLLWVWVAQVYPVLVTVTVNFLLLPAQPLQLLERELQRQLDVVMGQIKQRLQHQAALPLPLGALEHAMLSAHRHLSFVMMADRTAVNRQGAYLMQMHVIDRLHTAALHLSRLPVDSGEHDALWQQLLSRCDSLRKDPLALPDRSTAALLLAEPNAAQSATAVLSEMVHAINSLARSGSLESLPAAQPLAAASDVWSNPVYWQFALKTLLAAFFCYFLYSAVQWPGIQTAMVTCLVMALPSTGASTHKGLQRLIGCAAGSVLALLSTVFLVPHLEGVAGLLLLSLPVLTVAAWIAAGSARSSYIGTQLAFAYALALLGQFAPSVNLPEIRDRLLGIAIGVAVSLTIYTLLWPESEQGRLQQMLARLLQSIGSMARVGINGGDAGLRELELARLHSYTLLAQNRDLQARVALEAGWQLTHGSPDLQTWLAQAQETLLAVNDIQTQWHHANMDAESEAWRAVPPLLLAAATTLEALALRLANASATEMATDARLWLQPLELGLPASAQVLNRCIEQLALHPLHFPSVRT